MVFDGNDVPHLFDFSEELLGNNLMGIFIFRVHRELYVSVIKKEDFPHEAIGVDDI